MTKGGIIIRLIDVAMNLLFAFIVISDMRVQAQIKFPSPQQIEEPETDRTPAVISVLIGLDRSFVVKKGEELISTTNRLDELESLLVGFDKQYTAMGNEVIVLIEPNQDSVVQSTVDVMDICERHQIPMNVTYESVKF